MQKHFSLITTIGLTVETKTATLSNNFTRKLKLKHED